MEDQNQPEIIVIGSDEDDELDRKPSAIAMSRSSTTSVKHSDRLDPTTSTPKFAAAAASNKKLRTREPCSSTNSSDASQNAPMKLFATLSDVAERGKHSSDSDHWSRSQCWTLREMLGLDGNYPQATIDYLVVCNYMIDFDFLFVEVPELVSIPDGGILCCYGIADTPWTVWKAASPNSAFVHLDPSAPPGGLSNPLTTQIPYGVHHSKLFLVGFSDGTLRVIIHTANLRYNDCHLKAQAAYIESFPLKPTHTLATEYENDLASYLQSYRYQTPLPRTSLLPSETLVERIRRYDYSAASVVLIPSTPGYHNVDSAKLGHLQLKRSVRSHAAPVDRHARIVCQFSSVGSLTKKYLADVQDSMSARGSKRPDAGNVQLSLVYPTVEEIRTSVQGYSGGGSVPGSSKNVSKPFLRRLFCLWSPPMSSLVAPNPLWKSHNVPHIKTYYQTCPDGESLSWMVLSSHNLSKAAWGDAINTKFGRRLFIRHWKLGVFVSAKLLGARRLVPWTPGAINGRRPVGDVTVPLPYSIHPESYQASDQPWAIDLRYSRPDNFGRFSAHDD